MLTPFVRKCVYTSMDLCHACREDTFYKTSLITIHLWRTLRLGTCLSWEFGMLCKLSFVLFLSVAIAHPSGSSQDIYAYTCNDLNVAGGTFCGYTEDTARSTTLLDDRF